MEALPGALQLLETQPEPGRKLRIGVQDGIAPISSSRDDGSFGGLIPDLAQLVAEKLGWTFEYMVINSDNVAGRARQRQYRLRVDGGILFRQLKLRLPLPRLASQHA